MPFTEASRPRRLAWLAVLSATVVLAGCATQPLGPEPARATVPGAPAVTLGSVSAPAKPAQRYVQLPAPPPLRNRLELEVQLARRLVDAHPDGTYQTRAPGRLMAIPVLEIELNADGSVRRIEVLRHPSTGNEATQLAIAAVRRAAPYGDVTRLPRPWKVVEAFLFNDELRFKPRTLDLE